MRENAFELATERDYVLWAERSGNSVLIHRTRRAGETTGEDQVVARLDRGMLRRLLTWADEDSSVTASLTGPLAHEVRRAAQELHMAPEYFVWHAVKVFLEVGALEG